MLQRSYAYFELEMVYCSSPSKGLRSKVQKYELFRDEHGVMGTGGLQLVSLHERISINRGSDS